MALPSFEKLDGRARLYRTVLSVSMAIVLACCHGVRRREDDPKVIMDGVLQPPLTRKASGRVRQPAQLLATGLVGLHRTLAGWRAPNGLADSVAAGRVFGFFRLLDVVLPVLGWRDNRAIAPRWVSWRD